MTLTAKDDFGNQEASGALTVGFGLGTGNVGGAYRPNEGVSIIAAGSGYVVNSFQTGEWLAYTINVAQAGGAGSQAAGAVETVCSVHRAVRVAFLAHEAAVAALPLHPVSDWSAGWAGRAEVSARQADATSGSLHAGLLSARLFTVITV